MTPSLLPSLVLAKQELRQPAPTTRANTPQVRVTRKKTPRPEGTRRGEIDEVCSCVEPCGLQTWRVNRSAADAARKKP